MNDRHQKWSTYLQKFHLDIKYKKSNTNHVANCLSQPPIAAMTADPDLWRNEMKYKYE